VCIYDFEHALKLLDLIVLRIDCEKNFISSIFLCKITQVHESALCEKSKVSVAQLDIETICLFVQKAWELAEGFRAV